MSVSGYAVEPVVTRSGLTHAWTRIFCSCAALIKYASGSNSSVPSITGTPCVPLSTFEVGNIDEL